ncbi:MAG: HprK-related kinase A [Gammaproteobacteria bacterium]
MTLGGLTPAQCERRLDEGVALRIGPFTVGVRAAPESGLAALFHSFYPPYELAPDSAFRNAAVSVEPAQRRWPRRPRPPCVRLDDGSLFSDFGEREALPYLEWAINWCIATRCHQFLMLHAGVLEKDGRAVVLPGLPGAGKSTLSTYLAHRGWRLLSDEFCLLRPGTTAVVPFPRLVPLKNESIDVIAALVPEARLGPRFEGTRKGTVAHVAPPDGCIHDRTSATVALVVKPQFVTGLAAEVSALPDSQCFVELSKNAFNYQVLGRAGFDSVAGVVRSSSAHTLRFGDLEAAREAIEELMETRAATHA